MRHRQAIAILVVALALLAAWRGALAWLGRAAEFGESNYQANRIRIERYLARPKAPEYVVLGSSLSGRLRPAAFAGSALSDVAVLGLDGSSPLLGIAVLAHRADLPRVALVETFAFNRGWKANDQLLLDGLAGPGMRLARADRLFAADAAWYGFEAVFDVAVAGTMHVHIRIVEPHPFMVIADTPIQRVACLVEFLPASAGTFRELPDLGIEILLVSYDSG